MSQRHLELTQRLAQCGLAAAALRFALEMGSAQHITGTPPAAVQGLGKPPIRSVRITSSQVTDPDVAVSPDGKWMIITALGHLFRLSTAGGPTQQLTSGPYYDAAPAISPDGTRVAFISERGTTSQGNVFVLEIASGRIVRLMTNSGPTDRLGRPTVRASLFSAISYSDPRAITGLSSPGG
jgi:Tol biopolymer transport system component